MFKKNKIITFLLIIIVIIIIAIILSHKNIKNKEINKFTNPLLETKQWQIIQENQNINLEDYFYKYKNQK